MKKKYGFLAFLLGCMLAFSLRGSSVKAADVAINATNFPDANFRSYVSSSFDKDSNGSLSSSEIADATTIIMNNKGCSSLQGVEYFTSLTLLYCAENSLTALDVSKNTSLIVLSCRDNQLTGLNLSKNTSLQTLFCYNNRLTTLDVSKNTQLTDIDCSGNLFKTLSICQLPDLGTLNVKDCTQLTTLECTNCALTSLDVSGCLQLKKLACSNNRLSSLLVSSCTALEEISCHSNPLGSLYVNRNTALKVLYCYSTDISTLDVSNNTALETLDCSYSDLMNLNVSQNRSLKSLNVEYTQLSSLDVTHNPALEVLVCYKTDLTALDVTKNPALRVLYCSDLPLTSLNVTKNPALEILSMSTTKISSIDLSKNPVLRELYCYNSDLTSLDVTKNPELLKIICVGTRLRSLDVTKNPSLEMLRCYNTQIQALDIGCCPHLADAYLHAEPEHNQDTGYDYYSYLLPQDGASGEWYILEVDASVEVNPYRAFRVYGSTRYQTSIQIAEEFKYVTGMDEFDTMILVSGQDFPDGLSASTLADMLRAPILTTDGKASHYNAANAYVLENLAPGGTVYIIGGENAIPEEAVAGLSSVHCVRLAGNTRYLTNMAVLDECRRLYPGAKGKIIIATGTSFPDSLSVSSTGAGLFLVNGDKGTLTAKQKTYLADLAEAGFSFTIVGGTNAVSEELEASIEECIGQDANRIAGSTRYKTSAAIAEEYFGRANVMILCYGDNFPDALCAGPLGAALKAPVVLTKSGSTSAINAAKNYAYDHDIRYGTVLGGPALISNEDVRTILGLRTDEEIAVR